MIYLLAQYAQTLLDEYRPLKRTPPQIQPTTEQNPENEVSELTERNFSNRKFLFRNINKLSEKLTIFWKKIQKKQKNKDKDRLIILSYILIADGDLLIQSFIQKSIFIKMVANLIYFLIRRLRDLSQ